MIKIQKKDYELMKSLIFDYESQTPSNTSLDNTPYLKSAEIVMTYHYNTHYGDDRICECGHPYYRHFDSYENMEDVGCKYCGCREFKEGGNLKNNTL